MIYSFTIHGNHKNKDGNAVPKLKMTGKQHWMPKAQEYVRWKSHIQKAYINSLQNGSAAEAERNLVTWGKPIVLKGKKAHMYIDIDWSSDVHGDPENIFGSIADALFYNDKYLAGSFDFETSTSKHGKVDVTISVSES